MGIIIRIFIISALLGLFLVLMPSQSALQPFLQSSYIEGNVPPPESFEPFLRRDLLTFFNTSGTSTVTRVEFKLLRDAPTQSGVAYPKYYLWVKVFAGSVLQQEGVVRIAAIERKSFEVTDFISKTQVQLEPAKVGSVFPAALVPTIISLAVK